MQAFSVQSGGGRAQTFSSGSSSQCKRLESIAKNLRRIGGAMTLQDAPDGDGPQDGHLRTGISGTCEQTAVQAAKKAACHDREEDEAGATGAQVPAVAKSEQPSTHGQQVGYREEQGAQMTLI